MLERGLLQPCFHVAGGQPPGLLRVPPPGVFASLIRLAFSRHRLNGYLAQRVPTLSLASSFRICLDCEVLKGMFPGHVKTWLE